MKIIVVLLVLIAIVYFTYPTIADKLNLPMSTHELLIMFNNKEELKSELERKEKTLASLKAEISSRKETSPYEPKAAAIKKLERDIRKLNEEISKK